MAIAVASLDLIWESTGFRLRGGVCGQVEKFAARLEILPYDAAAAHHVADFCARIERQRRSIRSYDVLIAGHARSRGLIVVTGNRGEFGRVDGLRREDWGYSGDGQVKSFGTREPCRRSQEHHRPAEQFRIDYALSLVDAFAPGGHEKGFARIERRDVVEGLKARIVDPSQQNQSAASLCGPAVFLYCVLEEMPHLYAKYVIDLYKTGEGRLGELHVKPSAGCRAYQPPPAKIHPVDWIAMASLSDSENTLLDYSSADDTAAGITMPHSLTAWFNKLGWRGVRNNTNVFFVKGRHEVDECARFRHEPPRSACSSTCRCWTRSSSPTVPPRRTIGSC